MTAADGIRAIVDDVLRRVPARQTALRAYLARCAAMAGTAPPHAIPPGSRDKIDGPSGYPDTPLPTAAQPNVGSEGPSLHNSAENTAPPQHIDASLDALEAWPDSPGAAPQTPHSASLSFSQASEAENICIARSPEPNVAGASPTPQPASAAASATATASPQEIAARLWLTLFRPDLVQELGPQRDCLVKLDDAMIATLQRLITHGYLVNGEHVRVDHTEPAPDGSLSLPAVVASVTLCMMDETVRKLAAPGALGPTPNAAAELRLVQFLLTACTLPGPHAALAGENLRLALGQLARIFVRSKHAVNRNTARAALVQIITERMDTHDSSPSPKAENSPASNVNTRALPWMGTQHVIFSWMCSVVRGALAQAPVPTVLVVLLGDMILSALRTHAETLPVACIADDVLPLVLAAWPSPPEIGLEECLLNILAILVQDCAPRCKAAVEVALAHVLGLCDAPALSAKTPALVQRRLRAIRWTHACVLGDAPLVQALFANYDCDGAMAPVMRLLLERVLGGACPDSDQAAMAAIDALLAYASSCDSWALTAAHTFAQSCPAIVEGEALGTASDSTSRPRGLHDGAREPDASDVRWDLAIAIAQAESRRSSVAEAVDLFNANPKEGVQAALRIDASAPLCEDTSAPEALRIASWLRLTRGLDKQALGAYLGAPAHEDVLAAFTTSFDLARLSFVGALRLYLESFRLPGESQQIERFLEHFARHYVAVARDGSDVGVLWQLAEAIEALSAQSSPPAGGVVQPGQTAPDRSQSASHAPTEHPVSCTTKHQQYSGITKRVHDMVFQLAYSTIMLNTDMYSANVRNKMGTAGFLANTLGALCPDRKIEARLAADTAGKHALAALKRMLASIYDELTEREILLEVSRVEHPLPIGARLGAPWHDPSGVLVPMAAHLAEPWCVAAAAACARVLPAARKARPPGGRRGALSPKSASSTPAGASTPLVSAKDASASEVVAAVCAAAEAQLHIGLVGDGMRVAAGDVVMANVPEMGRALETLLGGFAALDAAVRDAVALDILVWLYGMAARLAPVLDAGLWRSLLRAACMWDKTPGGDDHQSAREFDLAALDGRGMLAFLDALASMLSDSVDARQGAFVAHYATRFARLPSAHIERALRTDAAHLFAILEALASPSAPGAACDAAWGILSAVAADHVPILLSLPGHALSAHASASLAFAADAQRAQALYGTLGHIGTLLVSGQGAPPPEAAAELCVRLAPVLGALSAAPVSHDPGAAAHARAALLALLSSIGRLGAEACEDTWHVLWASALAPVLRDLGILCGAAQPSSTAPSSGILSHASLGASSNTPSTNISGSATPRPFKVPEKGNVATLSGAAQVEAGKTYSAALRAIAAAIVAHPAVLVPTCFPGLLAHLERACCALRAPTGVSEAGLRVAAEVLAALHVGGHLAVGRYWPDITDVFGRVSHALTLDASQLTADLRALGVESGDGAHTCTGEAFISGLRALQPSEDGDAAASAAARLDTVARQCTAHLVLVDTVRVLAHPCPSDGRMAASLHGTPPVAGVASLSISGEDNARTESGEAPLLTLAPELLARWLDMLTRAHAMAADFNENMVLRIAMHARGHAPSVALLVLTRQETTALGLLHHLAVSSAVATGRACDARTYAARHIVEGYVRSRTSAARDAAARRTSARTWADLARCVFASYTCDLGAASCGDASGFCAAAASAGSSASGYASPDVTHLRHDSMRAGNGRSVESVDARPNMSSDELRKRVSAALDVIAVTERNTALADEARTFVLAAVSRDM